jgi:hypothetical protein
MQTCNMPTITTRTARCQENPDQLGRLSWTDPSPRTTLHMTHRPSEPGLGTEWQTCTKAETPGPQSHAALPKGSVLYRFMLATRSPCQSAPPPG